MLRVQSPELHLKKQGNNLIIWRNNLEREKQIFKIS
jgi:hypothetical protein